MFQFFISLVDVLGVGVIFQLSTNADDATNTLPQLATQRSATQTQLDSKLDSGKRSSTTYRLSVKRSAEVINIYKDFLWLKVGAEIEEGS